MTHESACIVVAAGADPELGCHALFKLLYNFFFCEMKQCRSSKEINCAGIFSKQLTRNRLNLLKSTCRRKKNSRFSIVTKIGGNNMWLESGVDQRGEANAPEVRVIRPCRLICFLLFFVPWPLNTLYSLCSKNAIQFIHFHKSRTFIMRPWQKPKLQHKVYDIKIPTLRCHTV